MESISLAQLFWVVLVVAGLAAERLERGRAPLRGSAARRAAPRTSRR